MSNYTESMIAKIRSAAPLNLEKATALASDFSLTPRSVISKAKQLGVEYVKKAPASKKPTGPNKLEIQNEIRRSLALPEREGDLTKAELLSILESIA